MSSLHTCESLITVFVPFVFVFFLNLFKLIVLLLKNYAKPFFTVFFLYVYHTRQDISLGDTVSAKINVM